MSVQVRRCCAYDIMVHRKCPPPCTKYLMLWVRKIRNTKNLPKAWVFQLPNCWHKDSKTDLRESSPQTHLLQVLSRLQRQRHTHRATGPSALQKEIKIKCLVAGKWAWLPSNMVCEHLRIANATRHCIASCFKEPDRIWSKRKRNYWCLNFGSSLFRTALNGNHDCQAQNKT